MDFISEYAVEIILVLSGILVGVINTLAGGGAIITMTLFTVLGLPIGVANGTNRIAVILQNFTATVAFIRKRMLHISSGIKLAIPAVIGGDLPPPPFPSDTGTGPGKIPLHSVSDPG